MLGTVGEPINPEAWKWYFSNVGRNRCSIVDTYWQTETYVELNHSTILSKFSPTAAEGLCAQCSPTPWT